MRTLHIHKCDVLVDVDADLFLAKESQVPPAGERAQACNQGWREVVLVSVQRGAIRVENVNRRPAHALGTAVCLFVDLCEFWSLSLVCI